MACFEIICWCLSVETGLITAIMERMGIEVDRIKKSHCSLNSNPYRQRDNKQDLAKHKTSLCQKTIDFYGYVIHTSQMSIFDYAGQVVIM